MKWAIQVNIVTHIFFDGTPRGQKHLKIYGWVRKMLKVTIHNTFRL